MEGWQHHHNDLILPKVNKLCRQQLEYLDQHFKTLEDVSSLSSSSCMLTEWTKDCTDIHASLLHLRTTLMERCLSWISHSFRAKACLSRLNLTQVHASSPYGTPSHRVQRILGVELPQLTLQLRRIHDICLYLETTLCLEALVGDLEDAVFCSGNHFKGNMLTKLSPYLTSIDFGLKQERFLQAIKAMNDIEEIIINVEKSQQQWNQLLQSVDNRVDKALSVLRSEVLAQHRALLASLGWPPKFLTSKVEGGGISEIPNPLVLMHGDEKKSYAQSFQVLCALQQLQNCREVRKFKTLGQNEGDIQLWAIDELVSSIAERMEYHFFKWAEQPDFIFALVYKITRDFVVGVSDILQPLIDAARLSSYSANEAWVSAMVHVLSRFLTKNVFPVLAERYKEQDMKFEVISLWLHLVDLIVGFDKRIESLVRSETRLFLPVAESYSGLSRGMSVLIIFCDRPDWLKLWAKLELKDGWRKLKALLKDARAWLISDYNSKGSSSYETFLLSTREDHKAPLIAESAVRIAQEMIDRCHALPSISARVNFVRSTVTRFIWYFSKVLLMHCKNAELTQNPDDVALVRACESINSARYIESKLQEWGEDVRFLEMKIAKRDSNIQKEKEGFDDGIFFEEEIKSLVELETNWLMEVVTVLLCQFENLTFGYDNNEEYIDEDQNLNPKRDSAASVFAVSSGFIEALDALRNQLHVLKINLNPKDFFNLWRSLADGLDHFFSRSLFASDVQFSRMQTNRFRTEMQALFLVFQPFCARPEAFFPCIRDILKLLTISKEGVKQLLVGLASREREKCMKVYGISHLSSDQVGKILRNVKF